MPKNKIIGGVLVVVGLIVAWQGWQAKQSVGSRISEAIQGSPSDNAIWLLAVGGVLIVAGAVVALRK